MSAHGLQKLICLMGLLGSFQAMQAQTVPALECYLGGSSFRLRPATGAAHSLNGVTLGASYSLNERWSGEASFSRQSGTEKGADLVQGMILFGPRYSLSAWHGVQGFAHVLVGEAQLRASNDWGGNDEKDSFIYGPGFGVRISLNRHWLLQGQGDWLFTHYANKNQQNPSMTLGVVYRP